MREKGLAVTRIWDIFCFSYRFVICSHAFTYYIIHNDLKLTKQIIFFRRPLVAYIHICVLFSRTIVCNTFDGLLALSKNFFLKFFFPRGNGFFPLNYSSLCTSHHLFSPLALWTKSSLCIHTYLKHIYIEYESLSKSE